MTETTYYTLLSVMVPRHGYAIIQYVKELTKGRLTLGTGTLYTMVGRLEADNIIMALPGYDKKVYHITDMGRGLLCVETERLGRQLADGWKVLYDGKEEDGSMTEGYGKDTVSQNGGGAFQE